MKFFLPGGLVVDRNEKPEVKKADPSPSVKPAVEEVTAAVEEVKPKAKRRGRPRKKPADAE